MLVRLAVVAAVLVLVLCETRPESVPSINAISCAPGQRFCMAVDNQGNVVPWQDGTFGPVDSIDDDVELQSVSSPTSILCEAIDKVLRSSGPGGWNTARGLTKPAGFATGSTRVACASSSLCLAVAPGSSGIDSLKYRGSNWSTALQAIGSVAGARPKSLSCTSPTFCLMTASKGVAALYNGSAWTRTSPSTTQLWAGCSGTTCRAIDQNVKAYVTTNGTTWSTAQDIHASTGLTSRGSGVIRRASRRSSSPTPSGSRRRASRPRRRSTGSSGLRRRR